MSLHEADGPPLVVVGDSLLDIDLLGTATRLCPDEPVPVIEDITEVTRPGGAGLAALLCARLRPTVLVTALGGDEAGERLREMLAEHVTLVDVGASHTVVKTRVRVGDRTVARLDRVHEGFAAPEAVDPELFGYAAAVLVSDYGLGVTAREDIRALLAGAAPTVWDPHPRGSMPVAGVTTVTPNLAEAAHFAGRGDVLDQARTLLQKWDPQSVTITRGADGAVLATRHGTPLIVPAPVVAPTDTCGAGDAFAAALVNALADDLGLTDAAQQAVVSAAAYLSNGGVGALQVDASPADRADPDPSDLVATVRARGGRVVMAGGCFDLLHAGHVAYLEAARALGDCLVVAVNSDDSVRTLKGSGRPVVGQEDRTRVLRALECVDAVIVFDEQTPAALLDRLRPDIFAKGGDYHATQVPETDVVRAYGGEVVVLPTLAGRSSTRLVHAARAAHHEEEQCRTQPA